MKKLLTVFLFFGFFNAFAQVKMTRTEEGMLFSENNKNILLFQIQTESQSGQIMRSNYVRKLWGLNGNLITKDVSRNELFQQGVFWGWQRILIDDEQIANSWELKNFDMETKEVEFVSDPSGAVVVKTEVNWKSNKYVVGGFEIPFLMENTTMTVHPKNSNYRKIDFEIHLLALVENLSIAGGDSESGSSGFALGLDLPEDVNFSGPSGNIVPQNIPVNSFGYVNISGAIEGENVQGGIVIVDNQENEGYPQQWILSDKNGIQNAVFPGRDPKLLSTVKPLVLKYSLIIYSGSMANRRILRLSN